MKKKKHFWPAVLITLFAFLIRLYRLGQVPISLHWDEAAWGYNAYSILKTGRDVYGQILPFILKSFGDYKPAFYVYLVAISEAIFGLNEFAVRLPSALFGSLAVFLLFLVIKELFATFKGGETVALIASFILATSPWHYHFSRGGWEVSVLAAFCLLGIWLFLKAKGKNKGFFLLSAFSFGLCFYIYQGAKMLVPLIVLGLLVFFWKKIARTSKKTIIFSAILLGIMALPIFFSVFGGAEGRWPTLHRYLNHFSSRFLFFEGDWSHPRHSVPNTGVLNHLAILFLPLGAFFLINKELKNQFFLWYLMVVAPIPAVFSRDIIQAQRSFFLVFPLSVITAFGVYFTFQFVKKRSFVFKWAVIFILSFSWLFSFVLFLDQFFVHAPIAYSIDWLYGYKEAVEFVKDKANDYDQVVFTQKHSQSYIYYLFYTAYEPKNYQAQARLIEHSEGDVGRVEKIDNIEFRNLYWPTDRFKKGKLFVGATYEIPLQDIDSSKVRILKEIYFLNGELAFRIVETFKK